MKSADINTMSISIFMAQHEFIDDNGEGDDDDIGIHYVPGLQIRISYIYIYKICMG